MKKIIASIVAAAVLATSAPAMAKDEDVIAGIIGGVIIGTILSDGGKDRDRRYERRRGYDDYYYDRRDDYGYERYERYDPYAYDRYTMPRTPRYYDRYCVTEQMVDRRGRVYFRRICQ